VRSTRQRAIRVEETQALSTAMHGLTPNFLRAFFATLESVALPTKARRLLLESRGSLGNSKARPSMAKVLWILGQAAPLKPCPDEGQAHFTIRGGRFVSDLWEGLRASGLRSILKGGLVAGGSDLVRCRCRWTRLRNVLRGAGRPLSRCGSSASRCWQRSHTGSSLERRRRRRALRASPNRRNS
jgi:hypothetical protein